MNLAQECFKIEAAITKHNTKPFISLLADGGPSFGTVVHEFVSCVRKLLDASVQQEVLRFSEGPMYVVSPAATRLVTDLAHEWPADVAILRHPAVIVVNVV